MNGLHLLERSQGMALRNQLWDWSLWKVKQMRWESTILSFFFETIIHGYQPDAKSLWWEGWCCLSCNCKWCSPRKWLKDQLLVSSCAENFHVSIKTQITFSLRLKTVVWTTGINPKYFENWCNKMFIWKSIIAVTWNSVTSLSFSLSSMTETWSGLGTDCKKPP